ncbi:MAG TPA: phage portal protein [Methylibium sp.]|nr:phage portal protein [Methylibium sp.]
MKRAAVTPNLLDRAIGYVDPARAARRLQARVAIDMLSESPTRSGNRPRRRLLGGADAATDQAWNLIDQRFDSRELVRSNGIAASAINTNVTRAVGTGLALTPQPRRDILGWSEEQAREWAMRVRAEFSLWADSTECDITGVQNFYDKQDLTLRAVLESGDAFTLMPDGERTATMPYALRLQTLEADRCGNEGGRQDSATMAGGVRLGDGGRHEAYFIYDRHPGSLLGVGGLRDGRWYDRVGAKSGRRIVLHHFKQLRPEQPRGTPYLAPVMALFQDLDTYSDAEIKAAVAAASIALISETPSGAPDPIGSAGDGGGSSSSAATTDPTAIKLKSGSIVGLLPGEKFESFNPGRPNPNFERFVQAVIDALGAGTFIGPEMLMKKYSTSYVAARAAFLDAWKHLLGIRTTIVVRSYCQPVYETWLAEAVAIGRIPAPGFFADPLVRWAYTRAMWTGDSQGSINPKDEVKALVEAVDNRLCSRERAEWELFGTDWNETYDTKKAEHDRLSADGMLPAPKAGAAAPASAEERDDGDPAQQGKKEIA